MSDRRQVDGAFFAGEIELNGYRKGWISELFPSGMFIAATLVVGVGIDFYFNQQHRANERISMTRISASAASSIERALDERVLITEGIRAAFEADPQLPLQHYEQLVRRLTLDSADVINVAAAPDFIIEFVYPLEPNQAALGLDLTSTPALNASVERAIAAGEVVIDGPIDLVQGGLGFVTRAAVINQHEEENDSRVWGVVSLVIDSEMLFSAAGLTGEVQSASISVRQATGGILFGEQIAPEQEAVESNVRVAGIEWVVSVAPVGGWSLSAPNRALIWVSVALSTILAIAIQKKFNRATNQTRRAERQLQEAISVLDDGFAIYDPDDRFIMCNQRYKEIYAASAEAMVPGATFEEILRFGLNAGQYVDAIGREEEWLQERLSAHREHGVTLEQKMPDGRWLRVVERKTESGNMAGFRVDITELKEALARAEQASASKSTFLNTVSHELRTPLTVVLGYNAFVGASQKLPSYESLAKALEDGDTKRASASLAQFRSDLQRFSKQIEASGNQLMDLIKGLLDLATIEKGTLKLHRERLELRPVLVSLVEQFAFLAKEKGIDLEIEARPAQVFADPLRLRQILFNLIGNAVKFTSEGQVKISVGSDAKQTWVEVADTGCGIGEDTLDRIFDPFEQVDTSASRQHDGFGLGLPISRELAKLHGGDLKVRSTIGSGSVFRLELDAVEARTNEAA